MFQYEHEREQKILVQKQLSTVQKAKDQIITDLKESNCELQGQIATLQVLLTTKLNIQTNIVLYTDNWLTGALIVLKFHPQKQNYF